MVNLNAVQATLKAQNAKLFEFIDQNTATLEQINFENKSEAPKVEEQPFKQAKVEDADDEVPPKVEEKVEEKVRHFSLENSASEDWRKEKEAFTNDAIRMTSDLLQIALKDVETFKALSKVALESFLVIDKYPRLVPSEKKIYLSLIATFREVLAKGIDEVNETQLVVARAVCSAILKAHTTF